MVLRYLWAMKAVTELLGTFEQSGGGTVNPFAQAAELVRLPAANEPAPPFALEKLQRLLSSPEYLAMKDAAAPHRAARFWLPLLCLFTCSRAKEVMRLEVFELERHGDAWVLRVSSTMSADPRTGGAAMRWVPLQDELVRCGFVAYVAQRKLGNGHVKMFGPGAEAETLSASSHRVSYWFSRRPGPGSGPGQECNLHALRRAFIAACLHSGICIEGIRLLAGRMVEVPATLRALPPRTCKTGALDQAVGWVRQLRFKLGLELSHLYVDEPLGRVYETYHSKQPKLLGAGGVIFAVRCRDLPRSNSVTVPPNAVTTRSPAARLASLKSAGCVQRIAYLQMKSEKKLRSSPR